MEDYYAARAGEYDRIYEKPERQNDLRDIERWLPDQLRGRRILELACGTGYWTQFLAPVSVSLTAVDTSIETLDLARARPANDRVQFVVGDAYALPDSLRRFDGAFAGFWLSHVPRSRLRSFFECLHPHLLPGSTVVMLDNLYVHGNSTPISRTDDEGNTWQRRALSDGSSWEILKNFPTEEEISDTLAGLASSIKWRYWSYFWAVRYRVE
jgi:demethylmenaquinone methyltransferase/2-methoxy-6-polyprenyl-1,4-benzoquinol methylase